MLNQSQNCFGRTTRFRLVLPASVPAFVALICFIPLNESALARPISSEFTNPDRGGHLPRLANPVPDVTKVGNEIEVHLFAANRGIKILRKGRQIAEENMNDGPVSLVLCTKASDGRENYNIA